MARLEPVSYDPFATGGIPGTEQVDYDPFASDERTVSGHTREFFTGIPAGAVEAVGTGMRGASAAPDVDPELGLERARTGLDASLSILSEIEKGVTDNYTHSDLIRRIGGEKSLLPNERIILDEALRGQVQGDGEAVARARAQLQQNYQERVERPVLPVTERPLWKAGEEVSEFAERHFGAEPGYEDALSRQVGEGLGSLATGVAVSATAGPMAGAALFTFMGAGEAADRAVQAGASDEDVVRAAGLGLGPGGTDVLPVEILLQRLPVPGVKVISESVKRFGGERIARAIGRIGLQGIVEAAQEGGQQALQNLIAREVHSPDTAIMEGVEHGAGIGGIVGGIAGLTREGVLGIATRRSKSPDGARAKAVDKVPPPTPEDEASPIRTEDIVEGRERVADAQATEEVNRILRASELPEVGTPVRVVRGREVFEGVVTDAVQPDEVQGIGPGLSITGADGVSMMDVSLEELQRLGISVQVLPMPAAEADLEARRVEIEKEAQNVADEYRREARKVKPAAAVEPLSAEEAQTVEAEPVFMSGSRLVRVNSKGELVPVTAEDLETTVEAQPVDDAVIGEAVSPTLAGGEDTAAGGAPATVPPSTSAVPVDEFTTVPGNLPVLTQAQGVEVGRLMRQGVAGPEAIARVLKPEDISARPEIAAIDDKLKRLDEFTVEPAAVEPSTTAREVIDEAESVVDTAPTDAQKDAGNYQKGHARLHGMEISIENPKGSERSGVGKDGKRWAVTMPATYGYIRRTEGADGDQVDVYVGPEPESDRVFVVDQVDADTKEWDEHKVMLGYRTEAEALADYDAAFDDGRGPERRNTVTPMTVDRFKQWLRQDTSRPVGTALEAPEAPPPAEDVDASHSVARDGERASQPMLRANGEPFKTRQSAMLSARNRKLDAEPVEVEGGWGLMPREVGAVPVEETPPPPSGEAVPDAPAPLTASPEQPVAPVPMAGGIEEFMPQDLTTDAKAFQYKEGGDEAGVTERLQGVQRWDSLKAGIAIIYERENGDRVIADGHQRLGLAKRLAAQGQDPRITGVRLREVDGYTIEDVREIAALKNIAEGTGSAFDAATVLRDSRDPDAALAELPPQSSLVRTARDIARLEEEPFRMAKATALPDSHVAVIGRIAEGDGSLQEALVKEFSDRKPPNVAQAEALARLFKEDRTENETTEDLFGEQEVATSFYRERARVIDITIRRLKQDKRVFSTLTRNARQIEAAGNVLAGDNQQIADVADKAAFLVQQLATRAGPISDAVKAAARQANETGNYQSAVGGVVEAVKEWAASGGGEVGLGARAEAAPPAGGREPAADGARREEEAPGTDEASEDLNAEPTASELEAAGQNILFQRARAPAARITGTELAPEDVPLPILRGRARRWYRENLVETGRTVVNENDGREIAFDRLGAKKTESSGDALLRIVPVIPDILRRGEPIGEPQPDRKARPGIVWHRYAATVEVGDRPVDVVLAVRERQDGTFHYSLHHDAGVGTGARSLTRALPEGTATALERGPGAGGSVARDEDDIKFQRMRGDTRTMDLFEQPPKAEPTPKPSSDGTLDLFDEAPSAPPKAVSDVIQDFGEKIEGARKDMAFLAKRALDKAKDVDIAAAPLSESFPQLNYARMAEEGTVAPERLTFYAIVRGSIPNKPRRSFRLRRWVDQVKTVRDLADMVMDETVSMDELRSRGGDEFVDTAELIAGLEPGLWVKAAGKYQIGHGEFTRLQGEDLPAGDRERYFLRGPGKIHVESLSRSREETMRNARNIIRGELLARQVKPKSKYTKINVYRDRRTGDIYLGFKLRGVREVQRLKTGFADASAAFEYIDKNRDELQAKIDEMRKPPRMRRDENRERRGADRREGDISPEQFSTMFGFRGVQFGNYVEGPRRQQDLNRAYDALMDMADAVGVPPRALSLNGSLGLAFGARGRGGRAAAHYEPDQVVINLTKTAGPGSLAHEWLHALDNNFGTRGGAAYATEAARRLSPEIRSEVAAAWAEVVEAMARSEFSVRAAGFDARRPAGKEYWSKTIEKAARAFERYIRDRLEADGFENDYLVNIDLDSGAYPTAGEMQRDGIEAAYSKLFDTLETRETDRGVELYRREDTPTERQAPTRARIRLSRRFDQERTGIRDDLERVARETFGEGFNVELAESITAPDGGRATGAFDPVNRIAYIALRSQEDGMRNTLWHEGLHYLRGAGAFSNPDGSPNAAWRTLERQAENWRREYGIDARYARDVSDMDESARERLLNEEAIAEALGDYAIRGRETGFGPTVRAALERVLRFFRELAEALTGRGFRTWEDVFEGDIAGARARRRADATQARAELDRYLQTAWHASPHQFDAFSTEHIGAGEGAQVYGWGLYFAERKGVADWYRDNFRHRAGRESVVSFDGKRYGDMLNDSDAVITALQDIGLSEETARGIDARMDKNAAFPNEIISAANAYASLEYEQAMARKFGEAFDRTKADFVALRSDGPHVQEMNERLSGLTAPTAEEFREVLAEELKKTDVSPEGQREVLGLRRWDEAAERTQARPGLDVAQFHWSMQDVFHNEYWNMRHDSEVANDPQAKAAEAAAERVGNTDRSSNPPLYRVDLAPAEDQYLLWDEPVRRQSDTVKAFARQFIGERQKVWHGLHQENAGRALRPFEMNWLSLAADGHFVFRKLDDDTMSWAVVPTESYTGDYSWWLANHGEEGSVRRMLNAFDDAVTQAINRDAFSGAELYRHVSSMQGGDREASMSMLRRGVRGIKYRDASSRGAGNLTQFLDRVPHEIDETLDEIDAGNFTPSEEAFLKELADNDWLGFDGAYQAARVALGPTVSNYEVTPALLSAADTLRRESGRQTHNYVVFDDSDVAIEEVLLQRERLGLFDTEETDQGEQSVIPGAERISDREIAERRMADPMRARRQQRPMDEGLFGETDTQIDLEEAIEASQGTLLQRERSAEDKGAFDREAKDWSGVDLTGAADGVTRDKKRIGTLADRIKAQLMGTSAVQSPNVEVSETKTVKDLSPLMHYFAPPEAWSRKFPKIHRLIRSGIKAEIDMSNRTQRLNREWDRITRGLSKKEFVDLTGIMFLGDAEAHTFSEGELKNFVTTDKVRAAYKQSRRFLDKLGRFTEQHRKAMALNVLTQRTKLLRRMAGARGMDPAEFRRLYDARADLLQQQRQGKRNPEKFEADLAEATKALHGDAPINEEYEAWAEEADRLEPQIRDIKIRRREGYVPHKFFGRWRIFREARDEDGDPIRDDYGEPTWEEVGGEQGFWPTRREAVLAASHLARQDPDLKMKVAPEQFDFPSDEATTLGDAAFFRFLGKVGEQFEVEGEALTELVKGVARRRFRRRIADFEQYRQNIEGYSKDLDRVMRTHIGETVRYVSLDRLKYNAINTIEREGLSPYRSTVQDRPELAAAVNQWFKDVNGEKQRVEGYVDNLFDKPWVTSLHGGLAAGGLTFAATGGLIGAGPISAMVGAYVGYRVGRGLARGGKFASRSITGAMLGDMSHLKLGMFFNLMSAVVNTTQVAMNTAPVLGTRDTAVGIKRFEKAVRSKLRGKPNADWRLLERNDIHPLNTMAEGTRHQFQGESRLSKISMVFFTGAESFNRGTTLLGAINKAQREGKSPKQAMDIARDAMNRTQFHYGTANKPELLRNVFLRVPLQFKNFVAQQLTFVLGLSKKELPKFLLSMTLVAGTLGIPGLDALDALADWLFKFSPIAEMKLAALKAAAMGELEEGIATFLTRGLPGLGGIDMAGRVGMGDKFLPLQVRDWKGAWWSTVENAARHGREGATIADQLRNVSPGVGNPLKVLENWMNGGMVTNPWKRNRPEYRMTESEMALKAVGARPIREARLQDLRDVERRDIERRRLHSRRYIDRIVRAEEEGDTAEVDRIYAEAEREGVPVSAASVRSALRAMGQTRAERELRNLPRDLRGRGMELRDAIGAQ